MNRVYCTAMDPNPTPKKPEAARTLPVRFVIYLPESATEEIRRSVETTLCERFGGVTSYASEGVFRRAEGEVQREQVRVVECYAEHEDWLQWEETYRSWLVQLCESLEQESIACSIDGKMVLTERPSGR